MEEARTFRGLKSAKERVGLLRTKVETRFPTCFQCTREGLDFCRGQASPLTKVQDQFSVYDVRPLSPRSTVPARLVPAATVHCPIRTSPFGRQELDADPESSGEKVSAAAPSPLMCTATAARFQSIHAAIAWCAGVSCYVDLGCYAIGLDLARTDWFEGSRNQGMLLVSEEIRAHMRPLVVIARDEVIHSRRLSASS